MGIVLSGESTRQAFYLSGQSVEAFIREVGWYPEGVLPLSKSLLTNCSICVPKK